MESISICIFSTKLGKRKIEKVVSIADTRIIFIGPGGEIPRASGKLGGLLIPSRDIMNSPKFCWIVRALKAERDLALIMHMFPRSDPISPFASCHSLRVPPGKNSAQPPLMGSTGSLQLLASAGSASTFELKSQLSQVAPGQKLSKALVFLPNLGLL